MSYYKTSITEHSATKGCDILWLFLGLLMVFSVIFGVTKMMKK